MPPKAATLAMKPGVSPAASSPQSGDVAIQTSKTWVLPERPKPGRKPSSSSAPTKRKAQNRDAQRAFRERRAQRVGELEQQIRDMEAEHRAQLEAVELGKTALFQELARMREVLESLQRENDRLRHASASRPGLEGQMEPRLLRHAAQAHHAMRPGQQVASPSPSIEASSPRRTSISFASIDDAFLGQAVPLRRRNKRSTPINLGASTGVMSPTKRIKTEEAIIEQDFTSANLPYRLRPAEQDGCGFCSDGTPCLCAEAAQSAAKSLISVKRSDSRDVASALETLATIAEEDNGLCSGNPGSCKQCQQDPMSTLFCRTLASQSPPSLSLLSRSTSSNAGTNRPMLPRANSSTFTISSLRDSTPPTPSAQQAYIPCSAAYQTLSRHANFDNSDLGHLVSGLHVDKEEGRGVSVASVRDALRSLDRGFGRDP